VEANASSRKHAAAAELIRRRPAPGAAVTGGPAQMPEGVSEFTGRELAAVLGLTAVGAGHLLHLSWLLEANLPGTKEAFRTGILSADKAAIIAAATALLDPMRRGQPRRWCWGGPGR
jgi:hypothetical protein